jgi:hypothetical protein
MPAPRTPLLDCIALAERQLAAARSLDKDELAVATRARAELLFELQVAGRSLEGSPAELHRLRQLDRRLESVLQAALGIIEAGTRPRGDPTYGANGRLRARA